MKLKDDHQRLWDLVRYMRVELHAVDLITDDEYADLVMDSGAVKRMEARDAAACRQSSK